MSPLKKRRLRFYLRQEYPVRVVAGGDGFSGHYPDLPGISHTDSELSRLYTVLARLRHTFISERVQSGHGVPLPNSGGRVLKEHEGEQTASASL